MRWSFGTAAGYQPIREYDVGAARSAIESTVFGPLLLAERGAPRLAPGGSIAFASGIAAYRPGPKGAMVAALNGALGSLAAETLAAMARRLPVGRIGRTNDIAAAIIALLRNGFITGTVLHADGGYRLV